LKTLSLRSLFPKGETKGEGERRAGTKTPFRGFRPALWEGRKRPATKKTSLARNVETQLLTLEENKRKREERETQSNGRSWEERNIFIVIT
jgi:hypothetical protein